MSDLTKSSKFRRKKITSKYLEIMEIRYIGGDRVDLASGETFCKCVECWRHVEGKDHEENTENTKLKTRRDDPFFLLLFFE